MNRLTFHLPSIHPTLWTPPSFLAGTWTKIRRHWCCEYERTQLPATGTSTSSLWHYKVIRALSIVRHACILNISEIHHRFPSLPLWSNRKYFWTFSFLYLVKSSTKSSFPELLDKPYWNYWHTFPTKENRNMTGNSIEKNCCTRIYSKRFV